MKNLFLLTSLGLIIFGCNNNPSKEARIQQLESKMAQTLKEVNKLESRVQKLESVNEEIESENSKNLEN